METNFSPEALLSLQNWLSTKSCNEREIDHDIETIQCTITFLLRNITLFDASMDKQVKDLLFNLQLLKDQLTDFITITTLTPQDYGQRKSS